MVVTPQKTTVVVPAIPLSERERETVRKRLLKIWAGPPGTLSVHFLGDPYCETKNA